LYYWFKSVQFWSQADALKGQTDMADYLSLLDIQALKIRVPPLDQQDGIAEVLGALDDKIAVNDRVAATALDLGDSFFWETAKNLPFGPESFGAVASVYGGGTPRTSQPSFWDGDIAWTTPTDVTALNAPYLFKTSRTITDMGLANCASQLYPSGSIFMTSRATIGAFAIPQLPAAVNQGFIVVVPPREELRWWLFHEMRSQVDEMLSLANGSTFLELSRKNFKAMPVRAFSQDVLVRFDAKVAPLHQKAAAATQESAALSELRDTLLPKLMSGEIRVRDAERVVGDVT
jgi:type I restriction enzyme S subunit